jgi:ribosomal protein L37AE/L43A
VDECFNVELWFIIADCPEGETVGYDAGFRFTVGKSEMKKFIEEFHDSFEKRTEWSNNCPNCNTELVYHQSESTVTWTCPKCGWNLATTAMPPIHQDTNLYAVYLSKNLSLNTSQIRTLSHLSGENFLQIKKRLASDNALLFKGKAADVLPIKKQLEQAEIEFQIIPEFNY